MNFMLYITCMVTLTALLLVELSECRRRPTHTKGSYPKRGQAGQLDDIYDELVMNTDTAVPTAAVPGEDNSAMASGVNLQRYELSAISKILYDLADILDLMAARPQQTKDDTDEPSAAVDAAPDSKPPVNTDKTSNATSAINSEQQDLDALGSKLAKTLRGLSSSAGSSKPPSDDNNIIYKPQAKDVTRKSSVPTLDYHPRRSSSDMIETTKKDEDRKFKTVLRKWMEHELLEEKSAADDV